jgi:hypothetical protein
MCIFAKTVTVVLLAACVASSSGCFWRKKKSAVENNPTAFSVKTPGSNTNLIITPTLSAVGRVASVNPQAKFAVVSFPLGQLPANDTRLSVFRAGVKVGELRVTGPVLENNTVGDIIAGTAEKDDEVRAE